MWRGNGLGKTRYFCLQPSDFSTVSGHHQKKEVAWLLLNQFKYGPTELEMAAVWGMTTHTLDLRDEAECLVMFLCTGVLDVIHM